MNSRQFLFPICKFLIVGTCMEPADIGTQLKRIQENNVDKLLAILNKTDQFQSYINDPIWTPVLCIELDELTTAVDQVINSV